MLLTFSLGIICPSFSALWGP